MLALTRLTRKSNLWPAFSTLVGVQVEAAVIERTSVRLRDYCEPLFSFEALSICPRERGMIAMSEEVAPLTHRTSVSRQMHPNAPPIDIPRSFSSSKMWLDIQTMSTISSEIVRDRQVDVSDPAVAYGPMFAPAITLCSLIAASVPPAGLDPSPSLPFWDKARMLLHGQCASPHDATEYFQMCGEPVIIRYSYEPTEPGKSEKVAPVGRVFISAKKVEWLVVSDSKEMLHAMLLQKPVFK
ncbi:hypothetical protein T484DRAFT_1777675, partial [Baffinella frigidus]